MEKSYRILILTDSNRNFLEIVLTDDLLGTIQDIYTSHQALFTTTHHLTRIVYEELFPSAELAHKRLIDLKSSPKMFRERLVRRRNPDWLNLYPVRPLPVPKKQIDACA